MHWFSSIYTALIKAFSVSRIVYSKPYIKILLEVGFFCYFFFTFYIQFILFAGKKAIEIQRFDQFTLITCVLVFFKLNRKTFVSNCRQIPVIIHRSASDKLAVDSRVLLGCGLSLIPPKREKECLKTFFQSKICEMCLANSPSVYIYTVTRTLKLHLGQWVYLRA